MFHFACGLLIINEDLQYARIIFFFLQIFVCYRHLPINTTSKAIEKAITSPDRTGGKVYYQSGSRTDCIFYYQSGRKCVIVRTEAGFVGTREGSGEGAKPLPQ